jgi:hypothetical protein
MLFSICKLSTYYLGQSTIQTKYIIYHISSLEYMVISSQVSGGSDKFDPNIHISVIKDCIDKLMS